MKKIVFTLSMFFSQWLFAIDSTKLEDLKPLNPSLLCLGEKEKDIARIYFFRQTPQKSGDPSGDKKHVLVGYNHNYPPINPQDVISTLDEACHYMNTHCIGVQKFQLC